MRYKDITITISDYDYKVMREKQSQDYRLAFTYRQGALDSQKFYWCFLNNPWPKGHYAFDAYAEGYKDGEVYEHLYPYPQDFSATNNGDGTTTVTKQKDTYL